MPNAPCRSDPAAVLIHEMFDSITPMSGGGMQLLAQSAERPALFESRASVAKLLTITRAMVSDGRNSRGSPTLETNLHTGAMILTYALSLWPSGTRSVIIVVSRVKP